MPNWCANHLTVTGPAPARAALRTRLVGDVEGERSPLSFQAHAPEPEVFPSREAYATARNPAVRIIAAMPGPAGDDGWYLWRLEHWGTKWEASAPRCVDEDPATPDGRLIYVFDTAWSPPHAWLAAVAAGHPDVTLRMVSYEPGADYAGVLTLRGDQITEDRSDSPEGLRAELTAIGWEIDDADGATSAP